MRRTMDRSKTIPPSPPPTRKAEQGAEHEVQRDKGDHRAPTLPSPASWGGKTTPQTAGLGAGRGFCWKSKQSDISSEALSRALIGGRPNVFSQNLTRLTWECWLCEMYPAFAYGLSTR